MNENQFNFERALNYEKNNQTLHAIQIYLSLINDKGFKRNALIRLVSIYERQNKINAAIELFTQFINIHENDDEVLIFFGHFLIKHGYYNQSVEHLNQVNSEQHPEVYFLLGIAYFNINKLQSSISNFQLLLKNTQSVDLLYKANIYLAKSFYKLNEFEKAEIFINDSRKLNPEDYESYLIDAKINYMRGMFLHAYELIRKASILNDDNSGILIWKGKILLKLEEFSKAEKHFRLFINKDYQSSEAFSMLGWACLNNKKYMEAEDYFARALIIDPRDHLARQGIIKCSNL